MNVRKEFNNLNLQYNRHSFYFEIDLLVTHHYRRACFQLPFNSFYYIFSRQQFQTVPKDSGLQMVLKTVIFVLPVSIIVIKVVMFFFYRIQTFLHNTTNLKVKCFVY